MARSVFERERRDSRWGRVDVLVFRDRDGEALREVVPLTALAELLDVPQTTVQGRYVRSGLQRWVVYVRNGAGRPERAFPLDRLDDVMEILRTPGARVRAGDDIVSRAQHYREHAVPERGYLQPLIMGNARYFTPQALAQHFGYSLATVRRRLADAGLMRRMVNLPSATGTGRPRRAFPESALGDVKLVLDDGVDLTTLDGRAAARDEGRGAIAQAQMASVVAQSAPAPARADQPVVNTVNSLPTEEQMAKEIDRALAQRPPLDGEPATPASPPDTTYAVPVPPRPDPDRPRWLPTTQEKMAALLAEELARCMADPSHKPSDRADEISHNVLCTWRPWSEANGLDLAALMLDDPARLIAAWDEKWLAARRARFGAHTAARRMVARILVADMQAGKLTDEDDHPVTELTAGHVFAVKAWLSRDVGMDNASIREIAAEVARAHGRTRLAKSGKEWEHTPECQTALAWLRTAWETENPTPDYVRPEHPMVLTY